MEKINNSQDVESTEDSSKQASAADAFDIIRMTASYPKVRINLLGNLHQAKTIHVIQEDDDGSGQAGNTQNDGSNDFGQKMASAMQDVQQKITNEPQFDEYGQVIVGGTGATGNAKPEVKSVKEVIHQDNIFEIEMQIDNDVEGGIDIQSECIHGHLVFLQVPSYQVESSLSDQDMTMELMQQICSINLRLYRQEVSGMQISNDSELQNIVNSANNGQYKSKIKKQMVKEYEIVDGYPILDEYEHSGMDRAEDNKGSQLNRIQPYKIDFRVPLRGIAGNMLSPTQLNVCNMFSTLYFMQLVVIMKSDSIRVPDKKVARSAGGVQVIESQPIMLKFIR